MVGGIGNKSILYLPLKQFLSTGLNDLKWLTAASIEEEILNP